LRAERGDGGAHSVVLGDAVPRSLRILERDESCVEKFCDHVQPNHVAEVRGVAEVRDAALRPPRGHGAGDALAALAPFRVRRIDERVRNVRVRD
jgi:hypothetical protein